MSLKILIVDNKIPFLDSAIRYLNLHERVELVGWALSGAEALDKIKIFQPDLVLIDVSLPDINGLSVIREIKKQFASQKIAVLTLHDGDDYRQEARLAGADGFISKLDFVAQFPDLIDRLFTA